MRKYDSMIKIYYLKLIKYLKFSYILIKFSEITYSGFIAFCILTNFIFK